MDKLHINQKVNIQIKLEDNREKVFKCKIKLIANDRLILKTSDDMMQYIDYLEEGIEVQATIFTPLGMIVYKAMIINSILEPEFVIEYSDENLKIQRREFLRAAFRAKFVLELPSGEHAMTNTIDLSAGGLKFYYEGALRAGQILDARLYLPMQMDSILVQGYIDEPGITLPPNQHLIMFTKINQEDIDRISKICLDQNQKNELLL